MPEQDSTDSTVDVLERYNQQRHVALTPRVVDLARRALDEQRGILTKEDRRVARLRVKHPTDTLAQLAVRAGTTKDAFSSRLRRLVERVELDAEAVSA